MTLPSVGAMAPLYLLAKYSRYYCKFSDRFDRSHEHEISCPSFADVRRPRLVQRNNSAHSGSHTSGLRKASGIFLAP